MDTAKISYLDQETELEYIQSMARRLHWLDKQVLTDNCDINDVS